MRSILSFLLSLSSTALLAQTISGEVQLSNRKPAANATVYLSNGLQFTTNKEGKFTIDVTPGKYTLYSSYLSQSSKEEYFQIAENEQLYLKLHISDTNSLDEVVIVNSRKPQRIAEIPGTVYLINGEKVAEKAKAGISLKEFLGQLVPGLDYGGEGRSNWGQNMRGRSVMVLIDGVSLNSARNLSRQFESIDPFNIEKIEILSGASSIYGGNATGGIINIVTKGAQSKQFSGETQVGLKAGFNSDDYDWKIAQSLQGGTKKWDFFGSAVYGKNGGFYNPQGNQILTDVSQTDLQYNQTVDLFGKIKYRINDRSSITASTQYYNAGFQGDKSIHFGDKLSGFTTNNQDLLSMKNGYDSDVNPFTKRFMENISYQVTDILGGQDLFLQGTYRNERVAFYPLPSTIDNGDNFTSTYFNSTEQNTNYAGFKSVLSKKWEKLDITYGLDYDYEGFNSQLNIFDPVKSFQSSGLRNELIGQVDRYPSLYTSSLAGYFQGNFKLTKSLKLSAGARYQNIGVSIDDFVGSNQQVMLFFKQGSTASSIKGGKSNFDAALFNASLLYEFNPKQQAWLNFSQGVALADPAKFYGYGKYSLNSSTQNWDLSNSINVQDNPLQGIKTDQLELGYRYRDTNFKFQIAGFISQSNKNLLYDRSSFQVLVTDDKLRNVGLEMDFAYSVNGFTLGANAMVLSSKQKVDNKWENQILYNLSPSKISSYLRYDHAKFSVNFQNQQIFKATDNLGNAFTPYNSSDLNASYRTKIGQFNVAVQNVLNTTYQTLYSQKFEVIYAKQYYPKYFPARGRTVNVTYTYKF
ncbi:TonB-dependent receptor [Sphingobacteriaceae bacterium WQ 2009]|uniref:TonB-dependent receptor n=1 Tax=Rhinopithecimicrobium faecis TaxID=2820698 RepID=A0A8T4HDH9_9SPHI|nr:TonB-dependent receptor [Sphingobacteriaceae bacterium WQ 2009]